MRKIESNKTRLKRTVGAFTALLCVLLLPVISLAAGTGGVGGISHEAGITDFATSLAFYAGAFSTAVTASVNPTATMAVLAIIGSIENAAIYQPDSAFLNAIADFMNGIPILREVGKLPIANPWAAVFLTLIAAALIVIHSFAETKALSAETIDKLDKLVGYICTVSISLLPFVTTEALEADPPGAKTAALTGRMVVILGKSSTKQGPAWYTFVLAAVSIVAITVVYYVMHTCVEYWEIIVAAIPVKGTSLIWQIVKAIIHLILVILQIFAPIISVIVSIHLAVAAFFLFRILKRNAQYYKDIYVYTVLRKIFMRYDPVPRIEKHVPYRLKKLYPTMEIAMSVYTFRGVARLAKRSRVWLIKDGDKTDIVYKRLIRKPYIISWKDLGIQHGGKTLYMEQCARFLRIRTEDRMLEVVMSTRYKNDVQMLSELLGLQDFAPVKQEIKETKKEKRKLKRMKKKALEAPDV